jgi:hypothetical protein
MLIECSGGSDGLVQVKVRRANALVLNNSLKSGVSSPTQGSAHLLVAFDLVVAHSSSSNITPTFEGARSSICRS